MTTAQLQIRRVGIDTWRENVAYLHRTCPVVRAAGFQALAKVEVQANGRTILAVLNVVDDERIVGVCELGLSEEAYARLGVPDGHVARDRIAVAAAHIGVELEHAAGQAQRLLAQVVGRGRVAGQHAHHVARLEHRADTEADRLAPVGDHGVEVQSDA